MARRIVRVLRDAESGELSPSRYVQEATLDAQRVAVERGGVGFVKVNIRPRGRSTFEASSR